MQQQNYKNHIRYVISFHVIGYAAAIAVLVLAIKHLVRALEANTGIGTAAMFVLIAIVLFVLLWHSRSFALKAQDRAIRAEESLRHFILTGKPLDKRITLGQVIALRFAGDAELPELARRAAEESLAPRDIKKAIQNWRADHHRV